VTAVFEVSIVLVKHKYFIFRWPNKTGMLLNFTYWYISCVW